MAASDSFQDLIARLTAGEDAAATALFRRYGQRLIALARTRLDEAARRKLDPEDVVQSVFRSFFTRHRGRAIGAGRLGRPVEHADAHHLRKCVNRIEYFRAECGT